MCFAQNTGWGNTGDSDGDGAFRIVAQRQARRAEDCRLFLDATGVGQHHLRVRKQLQEVEF